jgi:hypothetical protein
VGVQEEARLVMCRRWRRGVVVLLVVRLARWPGAGGVGVERRRVRVVVAAAAAVPQCMENLVSLDISKVTIARLTRGIIITSHQPAASAPSSEQPRRPVSPLPSNVPTGPRKLMSEKPSRSYRDKDMAGMNAGGYDDLDYGGERAEQQRDR